MVRAHYLCLDIMSMEAPSLSVIDQDNLSFREVVYVLVGLHFEAPNQSAHYHDPTNKQLNSKEQIFYNLLWQEGQELYLGCN